MRKVGKSIYSKMHDEFKSVFRILIATHVSVGVSMKPAVCGFRSAVLNRQPELI